MAMAQAWVPVVGRRQAKAAHQVKSWGLQECRGNSNERRGERRSCHQLPWTYQWVVVVSSVGQRAVGGGERGYRAREQQSTDFKRREGQGRRAKEGGGGRGDGGGVVGGAGCCPPPAAPPIPGKPAGPFSRPSVV